MKKIIVLALAALMAITCLAGCGSSGGSGSLKPGDNGEVNVCNWGEYIDESIFDDFEAQTGIKINYTTAASNEVLYSLLKSGGGRIGHVMVYLGEGRVIHSTYISKRYSGTVVANYRRDLMKLYYTLI